MKFFLDVQLGLGGSKLLVNWSALACVDSFRLALQVHGTALYEQVGPLKLLV